MGMLKCAVSENFAEVIVLSWKIRFPQPRGFRLAGPAGMQAHSCAASGRKSLSIPWIFYGY